MNTLRNRLTAATFAAGLLMLSSVTSAAMVTFGFEKITNNNVEDLSSQLSLTLWDSTEANSSFSLSLASNEILITVQNSVGIASNVSEVYIDDGLLMQPPQVLNSLSGFTSFSSGPSGTSPGNLPGGNSIGFQATDLFSADVDPGPPSRGVDQSVDILGLVYGLGSFPDFNAVVDAVNTGSMRFGYHVRSIGVAGGSDSYASVIPIPGALWLFASSAALLIGARRIK